METNFEQVFDKLSSSVKDMVSTNTIIGEEFAIGDFTCKPVIKVGVGYGTGKGEGEDPKHKHKGGGHGAGAAMGMAPVGFLVTKGDEISFIPADQKKGLSAIFEKAPDLVEKIMEMKAEKEK
jgi:uncharacterized spore protein YtfJ